MLRRIFFTGLAAIIPLVITVTVIVWLFSFVSDIVGVFLGNFINTFLYRHLGYTVTGLDIILGVIFSIFIIFLVGLLMKISRMKVLRYFERLLLRIPLVKNIYFPLKRIVDLLFREQSAQFKGVVLVEYPRKGLYSIGFITNKNLQPFLETMKGKFYTVFIPLSPTPFTGYTVVVPQEEVIELDMTIEEAVRIIVSGGLLSQDGKIR